MSGIAIYGCGGFGREVAPLAIESQRAFGQPPNVIFVSDNREEIGRVINGLRVVPFDDLRKSQDMKAVIAVADSAMRRSLVKKCEDAGIAFGNITALGSLMLANVEIGEGAIVCSNSIVTANVKIGRHCHINIFSYIAHDCVVGDFVTFAPRVNCNGNVVVEDDAYLGTAATLRHGKAGAPLRIGKGAVVGMGAVVTRDVAPGVTVIGNPARPMQR